MCEHIDFRVSEDGALAIASGNPADEYLGARRETELEFYSRRAMEEARLARRALTPQAAAAHRYLAAAYAALVAKETQVESELEELANQIL
jgi:hypothetical protein